MKTGTIGTRKKGMMEYRARMMSLKRVKRKRGKRSYKHPSVLLSEFM